MGCPKQNTMIECRVICKYNCYKATWAVKSSPVVSESCLTDLVNPNNEGELALRFLTHFQESVLHVPRVVEEMESKWTVFRTSIADIDHW